MTSPVIKAEGLRKCEELWAPAATVQCALAFCIPCAYKLLVTAPAELDNEALRPPCHANVRPELCPRQIAAAAAGAKQKTDAFSASGKRMRSDSSADSNNKDEYDEDEKDDKDNEAGSIACKNLYDVSQTFLIVGDGDFTFSLALARSLGPNAKLVCTSYQSEKEVLSIYSDAANTLAALSNFANVTICHDVDATKLSSTLSSNGNKIGKGRRFKRILFNFPCVPDDVGKDGQASQLEDNKALIRGFISSAAPLLAKNGGQIHIAHKTKEPFSWWQIPSLCPQDSGCKFSRDVVFDKSLFPGYVPRKVGENKSFPVTDAVVHCFELNEAASAKKPKKSDNVSSISDEQANAEPASLASGLFSSILTDKYRLVKITDRRLVQVVSLLQILKERPGQAAHMQRVKRDRNVLFGTGNVKKKDTKKGNKRKKARQQAKGKGK